MSDEDVFHGKAFDAMPSHCRELTEAISRFVPGDRPFRLLDLGCGTGQQINELAAAYPLATFVGVDISDANVRQASASLTEPAARDRIRFVAADYMALDEPAFDFLLADSTIQNIDAPTDALTTKIAGDLAPGGRLICTMPYACLGNRLLWAVRRLLRWTRTPVSDACILALATLVYGRKYERETLRQRIPYMYLLPHRVDDPAFRRLLREGLGLELVFERNLARASIAKPRHKLLVFQKPAGE